MSNALLVALLDANNAHAKACITEFNKLDLSPGQPKVLARLLAQEGYLQKELAALCRVEPATMTVLLTAMEKKGMIRKETSHVSGGKRAFRVYLTDFGRELAVKVDEIISGVQESCFEGFTAEEREQFMDFLRRMTANANNR